MLQLSQHVTDDTHFVHLIVALVEGAVVVHECQTFHVIKIGGWFGPKWLGFSHKSLGALGVRGADPTGPDTVPPFVPTRVLESRHYERDRAARVCTSAPFRLHRRQTSASDRDARLERFGPRHAMFWWSEGSDVTERGALMAYVPGLGGMVGWYAGFTRRVDAEGAGRITRWVPGQLRGVTRRELAALTGRALAFGCREEKLRVGGP